MTKMNLAKPNEEDWDSVLISKSPQEQVSPAKLDLIPLLGSNSTPSELILQHLMRAGHREKWLKAFQLIGHKGATAASLGSIKLLYQALDSKHGIRPKARPILEQSLQTVRQYLKTNQFDREIADQLKVTLSEYRQNHVRPAKFSTRTFYEGVSTLLSLTKEKEDFPLLALHTLFYARIPKCVSVKKMNREILSTLRQYALFETDAGSPQIQTSG